jgi:hypothetical protein
MKLHAGGLVGRPLRLASMSVAHRGWRIEHFRRIGVRLRLAPGRVGQYFLGVFLAPFNPWFALLLEVLCVASRIRFRWSGTSELPNELTDVFSIWRSWREAEISF